MTTLLIAEHDNATLSDQTAKAMSAAAAIGGDVHVLVAGQGAKPAAEAAAKLDGAAKVLLVEDASLEQQLAEPMAALIVSLADSYDAFVAPAPHQLQDVEQEDQHRGEQEQAEDRLQEAVGEIDGKRPAEDHVAPPLRRPFNRSVRASIRS